MSRLLSYLREHLFPTQEEIASYANDPEIRHLIGMEYDEDRPVGVDPEYRERINEIGGLPPILPAPDGERHDN